MKGASKSYAKFHAKSASELMAEDPSTPPLALLLIFCLIVSKLNLFLKVAPRPDEEPEDRAYRLMPLLSHAEPTVRPNPSPIP